MPFKVYDESFSACTNEILEKLRKAPECGDKSKVVVDYPVDDLRKAMREMSGAKGTEMAIDAIRRELKYRSAPPRKGLSLSRKQAIEFSYWWTAITDIILHPRKPPKYFKYTPGTCRLSNAEIDQRVKEIYCMKVAQTYGTDRQ